jgi:hypothetical protein
MEHPEGTTQEAPRPARGAYTPKFTTATSTAPPGAHLDPNPSPNPSPNPNQVLNADIDWVRELLRFGTGRAIGLGLGLGYPNPNPN